MRIPRFTQSSMFAQLHRHSGRMTNEIREMEMQAITGLKYTRPSDGPVETAAALRLQGVIGDQEVYQSNAGQAMSMLSTADETLAQVADVFKRARELSLQGASEQYNGNDRSYIADEVTGLRERLLDLSNTRLGERYLFSGTDYETASFDAAGTYGGSTDEFETQVADSQWATLGFDGSQVFQGTVDAFSVLDNLVTALNNDDPTTVQTLLADVDDALQQSIAARETVGHNQRKVDDAEVTAGNLKVMMQTELGELINADPTETYTRLSELRQDYTAAMQIGATASHTTLFGLLR